MTSTVLHSFSLSPFMGKFRQVRPQTATGLARYIGIKTEDGEFAKKFDPLIRGGLARPQTEWIIYLQGFPLVRKYLVRKYVK